MARIGIFGGTFDPIHLGHVQAGKRASEALDLDVVLFVVANSPWQKSASEITDAQQRLKMVEIALKDEVNLKASNIEIKRGGASYTIDTVKQLKLENPGAELVLLVGSDVAESLDTWKQVDELLAQVELGIIARPGHQIVASLGNVITFDGPDCSSTAIRTALKAHQTPVGLDKRVADFISETGLYA